MQILKNRYVGISIRAVISFGLIYYLFSTQDISTLKEYVLNFNVGYLVLAFLIILVGTYVSSWRWRTILGSSASKVSIWELYQLYLKGYFYNNFLPTQMGGDVYKSVSLGAKIKDQSLSLFSVFIDRFSGLIVLLVIGLFGIGSLYGWMGVLASVAILVVGLVLYFPILKLLSPKIKFLAKFEAASLELVKDKKRGLLVLGQSVLVQVISFFMVYVLFLGVGIALPLWAVLAFMPITSLAQLIPSLNGFGTQDAVYAFLFTNVGVTEPLSLTVSIMVHVVRLILSLLGGVLILFKL